uniref:EF-hand domain-containing protein n=1 Tax=Ascaris lumbricoides TaxID=6252 RepID=A0A0M3HG56_ASCLU
MASSEQLMAAFKRADADGNGTLDREEARKAFADLKEYAKFSDFDTEFDKIAVDGIITFER